jgi:hypothetical protein
MFHVKHFGTIGGSGDGLVDLVRPDLETDQRVGPESVG